MDKQKKEFLGDIIDIYSNIFREVERLNMRFFSLSKFLLDKGIMSEKEYDLYCSEDAINFIEAKIDERIKNEESDNSDV